MRIKKSLAEAAYSAEDGKSIRFKAERRLGLSGTKC